DVYKRQLPAGLKFQNDLASTIQATKSVASVDLNPQIELLNKIVSLNNELKKKADFLANALEHEAEGDVLEHAKHFRDKVIPAMNDLRSVSDELEILMDDSYWPFPTYAEMLYIY
ncbi:MAG: hypothetical protein N3A69_16565, partial [Leptospiraceae bacterium]|nr:hypothetical protein [Leptospiraceae bacterium]